MKSKEGVIKWLLLVMLFVTNYVNSENVGIQEQETLVTMMSKKFESEPRENNAHISRCTAKLGDRYTLQSRIRHADGKFSSNRIHVSYQGRLKFGKTGDSYVARRNTATKTREVAYSHIFRNVNSSLKLERHLGNIEKLSFENQRHVMFRKQYIRETYRVNDPLGKKSRRNALTRDINTERIFVEGRRQVRFSITGIYLINELLQNKSKQDNFRQRNIRVTYQINSPLENKSKQNREINKRGIFQTTYKVGKKTENVLEYAKRYTERSNTRENTVRETRTENYNEKFHFGTKVALNNKGKKIRKDRTDDEVSERNMRFLGITKNTISRIAKEERIRNNRMFMRTGITLKKKNVALKRISDMRIYTTACYENENPVTSQKSQFPKHTNGINSKFSSEKNAKEKGKIQNRMIPRDIDDNELGSKKNFESKAVEKERTHFTRNNLKKRKNINLIEINGRDERNDSTKRMQKLRSLNTDNSKYRSSFAHEIREGKQRSARSSLKDRNLNVKPRKINTKESQTVGRGNMEDKTSKMDRLSKNVEARDVWEQRTREVRTAGNVGERSENKRQKSNTLAGRIRRIPLDQSNRKGVLSKNVMVLRLTNVGSRDGRQEIYTEGNNQRNSFEGIRLDKIFGTQKTNKILEKKLKGRSAETIRQEEIPEYGRNNKFHGIRSNFRKQNMGEKKLSAKKVRFSENQEEIFESKLVTYYRVPPKENKNLHNENRISITNSIKKVNKQSTKNVESRKTVRRVESRSTETSGIRNIKEIERHNWRILGENNRWLPVDYTRQSTRFAEIEGKVFIRSVRNIEERSVKEIKKRILADQRNRMLQGKVQILERHYVNSRRMRTTICTNSHCIRENKNRSARSNEQISVANRKQERVAVWESYGNGFRGKVRIIEIPNKENVLTQRNLESRKTTTKFIRKVAIKHIQNRQVRSILKEVSTRGLQTRVRGLRMQVSNTEPPKINIISGQRVPNIERWLIKDRLERNFQNRNGRVLRGNLVGIRIPIAESYKTLSQTRAESSKMVKNFIRSVDRKSIHDRQAKTITEQRNKGLQRNEDYRKINKVLRQGTLNGEKWSRERSSMFLERNGRGFRGKMTESESQRTETNGIQTEQSVESYTTKKVLIPNFMQPNIQKRKLFLFKKQRNLVFNLRNGRGFRGKIMKQVLVLRTSNFDDIPQSKISDREKTNYIYRYSLTSNRDLNNLRFSKITSSRKFATISQRRMIYQNTQQTVKDKSYSSRNVIQLSKRMITASVPTMEKKLAQRMLQAKGNSFVSELTTREARKILKPTQQLRKYRITSSVHSEQEISLISAAARLAHREIIRTGVASYSRGSYTDNRPEILNHRVGDRSRSRHKKTNFSSKLNNDYSVYQKLGRNHPSYPPNSELNLLNAGSLRSVKNYQSSRKIGSSVIDEEFSKQTRYGSGRSRQLFDSRMRANVQVQMYSALGSVSMPTADIFQKDKTISAQALRSSEVSAGSNWNISGMNTASLIFNALFGILIMMVISGDNRLKSTPFEERLFELLFLRS